MTETMMVNSLFWIEVSLLLLGVTFLLASFASLRRLAQDGKPDLARPATVTSRIQMKGLRKSDENSEIYVEKSSVAQIIDLREASEAKRAVL